MSKCLWSRWKWKREIKDIISHFPCCLVKGESSWKKTEVKKKEKITDNFNGNSNSNMLDVMSTKNKHHGCCKIHWALSKIEIGIQKRRELECYLLVFKVKQNKHFQVWV